ncbi:hypothetical protein THAOC_17726, partial [Thalassiosira oceanica]
GAPTVQGDRSGLPSTPGVFHSPRPGPRRRRDGAHHWHSERPVGLLYRLRRLQPDASRRMPPGNHFARDDIHRDERGRGTVDCVPRHASGNGFEDDMVFKETTYGEPGYTHHTERVATAPGTKSIFDVRVTDPSAKSYRKKDARKVLETQEKEKKDKYLRKCLERRKHFTPLVFSVDGMAGREAKKAMKHLASMLAEKWERPHAHGQVAHFVKTS